MTCNKTRYSIEATARRELKRFQNEGNLPKGLVVYHCDRCLGWHFGRDVRFITDG